MLVMDPAQPETTPVIGRIDDEELASRSKARLLITAGAAGDAENLARRIHAGSTRAARPFVRMAAVDLPVEPQILRNTCSALLAAASGGTLLISDVERMPASVQDRLLDLVEELEAEGPSSAKVRVVTGTTVSLLDLVAAGTFSQQLFYRLNIIHLTV